MKAYESTRGSALRKRVKKVHAKAKFVGVMYLLGALALAALACMPMLKFGGEDFWVLNFWKPFKDLFGDGRSWHALIVSGLYGLALLTALINIFRCMGKLGWLTKRSSRYVNGFNRNMRAMEKMGKVFSGTFAMIVNVFLIIYMLQYPWLEVEFNLWAYVFLGAGVFIHFLCGLIGGTVSYFNVGGGTGEVSEEKRNCGLFVYFFRNLVQLAATTAIIWLFMKTCVLGVFIDYALIPANPFAGMDLVKEVVPVALQALILICLFVLVGHATSSTEFNRLGIEGAGMKNYRVFSFILFLAAGGIFAIQYFVLKVKPTEWLGWSYAIIAGIAFVAFLIDCIFKSKNKEEREEVEETDEMPAMQAMPYVAPMPMPQTQPAPNTAVYQQMPPMMMPVFMPQPQPQPVYMPVYYPMPYPMPANQPCAPTQCAVKPAPMPAPEYLQPTPSPAAIAAEKAEKKPDLAVGETSEPERVKEVDLTKQWQVRCPRCGKQLSVTEVAPYHRCPSCGNVFEVHKYRTYTRKS